MVDLGLKPISALLSNPLSLVDKSSGFHLARRYAIHPFLSIPIAIVLIQMQNLSSGLLQLPIAYARQELLASCLLPLQSILHLAAVFFLKHKPDHIASLLKHLQNSYCL